MLFAIKPEKRNLLGQDVEIMPLSVTQTLTYRSKYRALDEDDVEGAIRLMKELVKDCIRSPKITDEDLDPLDRKSLQVLFDACSEISGLSAEKKEDGNKTN